MNAHTAKWIEAAAALKHGGEEVARRCLAGQLGEEGMALVSKGAARFTGAILSGDIADPAIYDARRAVCRACPMRFSKQWDDAQSPSDYCGDPEIPPKCNAPPSEAHCGCLLRLKTLVASEKCPQARW